MGNIKESSHIEFWNVNNLYGWTIPQQVPAMVLSGLKIHFSFMKIL